MTNENIKLIKEIRRLMAEASGGNWKACISHPPKGVAGLPDAIVMNGEFAICRIPGDANDGMRDAVLIAALRNAAPRLLDAAERYERMRAALKETGEK